MFQVVKLTRLGLINIVIIAIVLLNNKMKAKAKKEVGEEDIFAKIFMQYKRKCDMGGSIINLTIKDMLEKAAEKNKLESIKFN